MTEIENLQAQVEQTNKLILGLIQAIGRLSSRLETENRRLREIEEDVDELKQLRQAQRDWARARERVEAGNGNIR